MPIFHHLLAPPNANPDYVFNKLMNFITMSTLVHWEAYIGITVNPKRRLSDHQKKRPWANYLTILWEPNTIGKAEKMEYYLINHFKAYDKIVLDHMFVDNIKKGSQGISTRPRCLYMITDTNPLPFEYY